MKNMFREITEISNVETGEWFFSTDHCQTVKDKTISYSESLVPCSIFLPFHITPREGFESGIINSYDEYRKFLESCGHKEIRNPNPLFQPEEKEV
jgi:hypothetical protein